MADGGCDLSPCTFDGLPRWHLVKPAHPLSARLQHGQFYSSVTLILEHPDYHLTSAFVLFHIFS